MSDDKVHKVDAIGRKPSLGETTQISQQPSLQLPMASARPLSLERSCGSNCPSSEEAFWDIDWSSLGEEPQLSQQLSPQLSKATAGLSFEDGPWASTWPSFGKGPWGSDWPSLGEAPDPSQQPLLQLPMASARPLSLERSCGSNCPSSEEAFWDIDWSSLGEEPQLSQQPSLEFSRATAWFSFGEEPQLSQQLSPQLSKATAGLSFEDGPWASTWPSFGKGPWGSDWPSLGEAPDPSQQPLLQLPMASARPLSLERSCGSNCPSSEEAFWDIDWSSLGEEPQLSQQPSLEFSRATAWFSFGEEPQLSQQLSPQLSKATAGLSFEDGPWASTWPLFGKGPWGSYWPSLGEAPDPSQQPLLQLPMASARPLSLERSCGSNCPSSEEAFWDIDWSSLGEEPQLSQQPSLEFSRATAWFSFGEEPQLSQQLSPQLSKATAGLSFEDGPWASTWPSFGKGPWGSDWPSLGEAPEPRQQPLLQLPMASARPLSLERSCGSNCPSSEEAFWDIDWSSLGEEPQLSQQPSFEFSRATAWFSFGEGPQLSQQLSPQLSKATAGLCPSSEEESLGGTDWPPLGEATQSSQQPTLQLGPTPSGGAWGGAKPKTSTSGRARSIVATTRTYLPGKPPGSGETVSSFRGMSFSEGGTRRTRNDAQQERMSLVPPVMTRPPDILTKKGTAGRSITVEANYFKVTKTTDWNLYQYDVSFIPDEYRRRVRKAILETYKEALNLGNAYLFDGKILFTTRLVHIDINENIECLVRRPSDNSRIKITIKLKNIIEMNDFSYIQFLNIILSNDMDLLKFELIGKEYFEPTKKVLLKNHRLELWPGYVTSISQHDIGILMNVEIVHKIIRTDTVLDLMNEVKRQEGDKWQKVFRNGLLGQTVVTHYNNKPYTVVNVSFDKNPESTFKMNKKLIKYVDHYKTKYNLFIQNRHQPLLLARVKHKGIRGTRFNNFLIPELCYMTGLTDEMRNNLDFMKAVYDNTRLPPISCINKYYHLIDAISTSPETTSHLQTWKIRFETRLQEMAGRILPNERLQFHDEMVEVRDGDWTRDMERGRGMFCQALLRKWIIIYPPSTNHTIDTFIQAMKTAADSVCFPLPVPDLRMTGTEESSAYAAAIEETLSQRPYQLVLVIINSSGQHLYKLVKTKTLVERSGVASQVVLKKTLRRKNLPFIATRLIIQMNCKLGGSPWFCSLPFQDPTMVIGLNVCHAVGGGIAKKRSYGAMVANTDPFMTRWYSIVLDHEYGSEFFDSLPFHVLTACERFAKNTGVLPGRIIFYRDVLEDSYDSLLYFHEVKQIEEVLLNLYRQHHSPKFHMAYIVVSKQNQTRIFVGGMNPPPGTLVDDVITRPERYDFFLVSQSVRQDTVSPTNYHILYDRTDLTPDEMQRLTYKLCHLYYNCSNTVRVPAQLQYAAKLASFVGQLGLVPNIQNSEILYYL